MKKTDKNCHFVKKGWGWELWLANYNFSWHEQGINSPVDGYCGKKMCLLHGKQCSWHYHDVKQETFFILRGKMKVLYGMDDDISNAEETILGPGDIFDVHHGLRHRFIGESEEDCIFIEFSTYHREEDSIRIEKGD